MSNKIKDLILIGIFVCLLIIALKPVPQMNINQPQTPAPSLAQTVIQLGPNRIAIIETNNNSGEFGSILVFDYDGKSFKLLGKYNYSDYFRNPQQQKPVMPSLP